MIKNEPDIVTLSGDQLDRAQQALDVARHQIRLSQHEAADYRVEEALTDAEEAVDTARAKVTDAVEVDRAQGEDSGAAEGKRKAWRPGRPVA